MRLSLAAIAVYTLAICGCRGALHGNCDCGCGPVGGALRAKLAPPIDDGPHAITPPHSRFHPVPTHPVFATHAQHLEELPPAGNGVRIPASRGSSVPTKSRQAPPKRTPDNGPLERTPAQETRPDDETPRVQPHSGSSGVTLNGPRAEGLPDSQINLSPYGGWRGRRIVR